jgi:hypothetical protein
VERPVQAELPAHLVQVFLGQDGAGLVLFVGVGIREIARRKLDQPEREDRHRDQCRNGVP